MVSGARFWTPYKCNSKKRKTMSKDILGLLKQAFPAVPKERLRLLRDFGHKLGGRRGKLFALEAKQLLRRGLVATSGQPTILIQGSYNSVIKLDSPFDPESFVARGWSVKEEDTDPRGESINELDLSKVKFLPTIYTPGESVITGVERLSRLKLKSNIRLGGRAFKACWDNRSRLPAQGWDMDGGGKARLITFDGMTLVDPLGDHYVLYLFLVGGDWYWRRRWLDRDFGRQYQSAIL